MTYSSEIYGITGKKGHGKDTFARLVRTYEPSFSVMHFASPIKNMCKSIFGLIDIQLSDPTCKEMPFESPIHMDSYINEMSRETGLKIVPQNLIANSPREVMQFLGTEYVRSIQDDYWIQKWKDDVKGKNKILAADCRYINEANTIKLLGGAIIKIIRIDRDNGVDTHKSESEQDQIIPDLTIGVKTNDLSMADHIASLIAENKLYSATKYDYDRAMVEIENYKTLNRIINYYGDA